MVKQHSKKTPKKTRKKGATKPRHASGRGAPAKKGRSDKVIRTSPQEESDREVEILETPPPPVDDETETTALAPYGGGAVERFDPLKRYLAEIRRYDLLTPDQEKTLTRRYFESQDEASAQQLVLANLRLVVKIAFQYIQTGFKVLDLIQEGNVGLMQAVKEYNPYKGAKFSYYASFWIKAYIQNFILKNWSLVKIGTTQAQRKLFYQLKREKRQIEAMGFSPSPKLLSERLGVKESEVIEMDNRLSGKDVSLDQPAGSESDGENLLDYFTQAESETQESLESREILDILRSRLKEFAKTLEGKEKVIFEKRLMAEDPLTLQEIGDQYDISRERVRQIEKKLMDDIKAKIKPSLS